MASAPYWGNLPSSKAAGSAANGASQAEPDHRASLDVPAQLQPKPKRISVQTTNTEAPTESSMSPFDSPTSSSFPEQGLAPRPPSFQRPSGQYSSSRPESRDVYKEAEVDDDDDDDDDDYDDGNDTRISSDLVANFSDLADPPPTAPDAPRGPPLSYRPPHAVPQTYGYPPVPLTAPVAPRKPELSLSTDPMDLDSPDKEPPAAHTTHTQPADDVKSPSSASAAGSSHPHRGSAGGGQSEHRKKLDKMRSPLQKLELTLDSITKEEKRARAEAAEQAFRERESRAVSGAGQQQQGQHQSQHASHARAPPQQAKHHERSAAASDGEPRPLLQPDASPVEESYSPIAAQGSSVPHNVSDASTSPSSEQAAMRSRVSSMPSKIPQRNNMTSRERTARDELKQAHADGEHTGLPDGTTPPKRTSSLQAMEMSGDAWYYKRAAAERRYHESMQAAPTNATPRALPQPPFRPHDQAAPPKQRRVSVGGHVETGFERIALGYDGTREGGHAVPADSSSALSVPSAAPTRRVARFEDIEEQGGDANHRFDNPHRHRISNMLYHAREDFPPGQGTYIRPTYLNEWQKGTIGLLHGPLLDLTEEPLTDEMGKAWWEKNGKRRPNPSFRMRLGEAYDGEYDEANGPTRFKPPLHLVCGPLLRYCGIRKEQSPSARANRNGNNGPPDMEFWRGSVMIVTRDTDSSYDIAPTLRMFLQPMELLAPAPSEVDGSLPAEYIDPLVGHPKLGRNGETKYVRPVEQIPEGRDLSKDETDRGLFERTRSAANTDVPGSFAARLKKVGMDGERVGKFKDVRAFRLHAERGVTFWRFNLEIELRETQQRIAYRINRGPATGFWVPAKGQAMHIMFYSCNGFSLNVNPNDFSGPDPMWRDVLNNHQTQPFHVMIGGGDQIYNDIVMNQTQFFQEWLSIKNPLQKHNAPFTAEMQDELEAFYLNRYAMWFSQGLFSLANCQIPMVNMYDDHDIIDGFGSYPHHFMNSPVFSGLGNVAFKYYILFQHQSVIGETEESESSWILGKNPGPYIEELSHSLFMSLGGKIALLAVDCRTERMRDEIVHEDTWKRIMDRCYAEIDKGTTEHLIVLLGVPIAYPRLVWLENILTSRLMDPIKALGKTGLLGGFLNRFDGGVEVLDDLDDHWTAKEHKDERKVLIEDLQDLAADKSVRVTILSGDVHLAAVGEFYANPKLSLAKHRDFRYMPNVISSAIANRPPADLLADVLNKRNKVHHFDSETDEDMIPLFAHGVDGRPRNNKRLLPHRNWCSIQPYVPGTTPAGTPSQSAVRLGGRNVLQRESTQRGSPYGHESRPPVSTSFLRTLSRGHAPVDNVRAQRTGSVKRSYSLSGGLFRRLSSRSQRAVDGGGVNGSWTAASEGRLGPGSLTTGSSGDEAAMRAGGPRMRGGAAPLAQGNELNEFEAGDETLFSVKRRPAQPPVTTEEIPGRKFYRTPTGLTARQAKRARDFVVNLEGGLDIRLNVEVNPRDPTGITVPYRLVVPRLWYTYDGETTKAQAAPSGLKRLLSLGRRREVPAEATRPAVVIPPAAPMETHI